MIKFEDYIMDSASMGDLNPMPDIKNVSYIHAGFEVTEKLTDEEKKYLGKGMINTILPYKNQDGYDRNRKPRAFKVAVLENKFLKAVFLPELGGRLWSIFDKEKNKELLYVNPVFQPGNLGIRNAWFSGGVEFNVGIKGHNPLTCSPMWCAVDKTENGEILRLYEYERIREIVYSISAYLPEDSKVLYIKDKIENTSNDTKYMYWWSNIAVPETKGTRVIVPADDSFLSFYNENHYVVDKASIPLYDGVDVSYPAKISSSRDFFYKIPENDYKWIASADETGFGLLQCSTQKLKGRKLFVWGMSTGGRHWNEWLSEKDSAYIEIQAGLAHTQLEHIPMEGKTSWEWVEAYTALDEDAGKLHNDYSEAVKTVNDYMLERLGNPDKLEFPSEDEVISSEIIYKGSDWGAIEEMIRGEKISAFLAFPKQDSEETKFWSEYLANNKFCQTDVLDVPQSYVTGEFWKNALENAQEKTWVTLLHEGVVKYALEDIDGAKQAWEKSLEMKKSPWALRNIAMLYKNEFKDLKQAEKFILEAFEMKKDCLTLVRETAALLIDAGNDLKWLEIYNTLCEEFKNDGRLKIYFAMALIKRSEYDKAREIVNKDFIMSDIKEGELSISYLWFELYRRIYAKEIGKEYDENDKELIKAADEKYPLPAELDFRMHD